MKWQTVSERERMVYKWSGNFFQWNVQKAHCTTQICWANISRWNLDKKMFVWNVWLFQLNLQYACIHLIITSLFFINSYKSYRFHDRATWILIQSKIKYKKARKTSFFAKLLLQNDFRGNSAWLIALPYDLRNVKGRLVFISAAGCENSSWKSFFSRSSLISIE